jgi:predicted PurR-regulated permease PerM
MPDGDRSLRAWWALVLVLAAILIVIAHAFVGTIVFAVFLYYAVRPVNHRIRKFTNRRKFAAAVTLFLVLIPLLILIAYIISIGINNLDALLTDQVRQAIQPYVNVSQISSISDMLGDQQDITRFVNRLDQLGPLQTAISIGIDVLLMIMNFLINLALIIGIVYYLLRDGARIEGWFREEAGVDSAAYAYARGVDSDLESVYFGNVITILMIAILSVIWYNLYNVIAPSSMTIPIPTLLALLTGVAAIIPIVVGKLVYLPITLYLTILAIQTNVRLLWYPAIFVVVAFLFLDFIPQTFIQPYIAGRNIHVGLMIFAYIFGGLFFGWYGLFLGPIILVLALQAIRIVVTDLLHGGPVTPRPTAAEDLGSDPALEEQQ